MKNQPTSLGVTCGQPLESPFVDDYLDSDSYRSLTTQMLAPIQQWPKIPSSPGIERVLHPIVRVESNTPKPCDTRSGLEGNFRALNYYCAWFL